MRAYIFPGQGAQFPGMGKEVYQSKTEIKELMDTANDILGFDILKIMFEGTEEELKATKVTQPAIFIHSIAVAKSLENGNVGMVAGHSLGEFSALVAMGCLSFEEGLLLVKERALAMQEACNERPSSMAAIIGLEDEIVEEVCKEVEGIVVPANYNSPGQLVISGETEAVKKACEILKSKGAKRALMLPVNGAFHSPLMQSAQERLSEAIDKAKFSKPVIPIYQNVTALPSTDVEVIKDNLKKQLTGSVKWTQTIKNMVKDGATEFYELGPGKALQGMVKKIFPDISVTSAS